MCASPRPPTSGVCFLEYDFTSVWKKFHLSELRGRFCPLHPETLRQLVHVSFTTRLVCFQSTSDGRYSPTPPPPTTHTPHSPVKEEQKRSENRITCRLQVRLNIHELKRANLLLFSQCFMGNDPPRS